MTPQHHRNYFFTYTKSLPLSYEQLMIFFYILCFIMFGYFGKASIRLTMRPYSLTLNTVRTPSFETSPKKKTLKQNKVRLKHTPTHTSTWTVNSTPVTKEKT